jgi:hypothetical protein
MCIVEVSLIVIVKDIVGLLDGFEPDLGGLALGFGNFVRMAC